MEFKSLLKGKFSLGDFIVAINAISLVWAMFIYFSIMKIPNFAVPDHLKDVLSFLFRTAIWIFLKLMFGVMIVTISEGGKFGTHSQQSQ